MTYFRSGSSVTNIYRVGHRGKVDLECIPGGAAVNGHYFPDHLPVLGRAPSLSVTIAPPKTVAVVTTAPPATTTTTAAPPATSTTSATATSKPAHDVIWSVGERVEVSVSFEALQQLQVNNGSVFKVYSTIRINANYLQEETRVLINSLLKLRHKYSDFRKITEASILECRRYSARPESFIGSLITETLEFNILEHQKLISGGQSIQKLFPR